MDKSEKEITVTKATDPVDGPADGVMIDTKCIRTDFLLKMSRSLHRMMPLKRTFLRA